MDHEFNNRIAAQRHILQLVNRTGGTREDLFGLSRKALTRWASVNSINLDSRLFVLVTSASEKLFFLANKSQEQVSSEYLTISREIAKLSELIETELVQPATLR